MKTKPNSAVFATSSDEGEDFYGLTKREYFAAMAMQSFLSNPMPKDQKQLIGQASVAMADALIDALNRYQSS